MGSPDTKAVAVTVRRTIRSDSSRVACGIALPYASSSSSVDATALARGMTNQLRDSFATTSGQGAIE
jgi:hypothetical protein